jgi:hypothetical protein
MKRTSFKHEAYDHHINPCNSDGRPCGHGIHNETWHYVASLGRIALALEVNSGIYLPCTFATRFVDGVHGVDLAVHIAFPTDIVQLTVKEAPMKCEWVDGGRCYGGSSSSLAAREFVEAHFVETSGFEQPDSFWSALEDKLAAYAREADAARVDLTHERCHHCDGIGVVRK